MKKYRVLAVPIAALLALGAGGTYYVASPTISDLKLAPPLKPFQESTLDALPFAKDFPQLARGFRPQVYRSFCGPASIATVLRAYGVGDADQTSLFPSWAGKVKAFYTGMTLAELDSLARSSGLRTQIVYADEFTVETFRERLKQNLSRAGDFVVVNYDRRVLEQKGAGHISPVAAYDPQQDAFLVLDEASYHYPFTWVPAPLLFAAVHTKFAGRFRGVLFIEGYREQGRIGNATASCELLQSAGCTAVASAAFH